MKKLSCQARKKNIPQKDSCIPLADLAKATIVLKSPSGLEKPKTGNRTRGIDGACRVQ